MPRVQRQNLPRDLWKHLLDRLKRRNISVDQLGLLADWLATEPEVPHEKWFKKFPSGPGPPVKKQIPISELSRELGGQMNQK